MVKLLNIRSRTSQIINFCSIFVRDGYEYRVMQVLGQRLNFTFDIGEPRNLVQLGYVDRLFGSCIRFFNEVFQSPGDAVAESIIKRQFDIGMAGLYVTTERNDGMEMAVSHETDCSAFITMASKALPR